MFHVGGLCYSVNDVDEKKKTSTAPNRSPTYDLPYDLRGTLGLLARSMVTNFLHTARINMSICDASVQ